MAIPVKRPGSTAIGIDYRPTCKWQSNRRKAGWSEFGIQDDDRSNQKKKTCQMCQYGCFRK